MKNNELIFTQEFQAHQGDTQWFSCKVDVSTLEKVPNQFIARSEQSGSVHALCGDYTMYKAPKGYDGFVIKVNKPCILNHTLEGNLKNLKEAVLAPPKDHRHTEINPGVYFVGIQRQADPLTGYFERVRD